MSTTTMLERANPLNDLRPAPRTTGRARSVLAELDEEVSDLFEALDPAPAPKRVRRALTPVPVPKIPPVRPRRRFIPRITVQPVHNLRPVTPTELPRSLHWLPMLHGHDSVNAVPDAIWRQWLTGWDRTIVLGYRLARTKAAHLRTEVFIRHSRFAAKLRRITEYHTQAVWQDYLAAFSPIEGVDNVCGRVLRGLERLDALAQS
jgi:hypothetical protein